ncbi:MAG: hypothetical protein MR332_04725 [Fusicatenibacter sp.]|nr:hypothetical protein [Fusicatenibacter sp.]
MKFGWINLFGAAVVLVMLIPNLFYARKHGNEENRCKNQVMNLVEQIGRYSCFILMWLPLLVWKFGFHSVAEMCIYLIGSLILLLVYLIIWALYLKRQTAQKAMALAVIPVCIFLMSGILLRHYLLVAAALVFGAGHIYVTRENQKQC